MRVAIGYTCSDGLRHIIWQRRAQEVGLAIHQLQQAHEGC